MSELQKGGVSVQALVGCFEYDRCLQAHALGIGWPWVGSSSWVSKVADVKVSAYRNEDTWQCHSAPGDSLTCIDRETGIQVSPPSGHSCRVPSCPPLWTPWFRKVALLRVSHQCCHKCNPSSQRFSMPLTCYRAIWGLCLVPPALCKFLIACGWTLPCHTDNSTWRALPMDVPEK
jgi:hypothetical protein